MTIPNDQIGSSNESKLLRYILKQVERLNCLLCNLMNSISTLVDEKVKYDAGDPVAGYLSEIVVAGTGIIIVEGTGADVNKVRISAECICIEVSQTEPTNPSDGLLWWKPELCTTTTTTLFCAEPLCETVMTVGFIEESNDIYGYGREMIGEINPDCQYLYAISWAETGILLVQSLINLCSIITLIVDDEELILPFVQYDAEVYYYILEGTSNPFPAEGQTCNIRICGSICTTTTTTIEPTTTTTTIIQG